MIYIALAVVLYVVIYTVKYALQVLSEGNRLGAVGIGILSLAVVGMTVYQFFIR